MPLYIAVPEAIVPHVNGTGWLVNVNVVGLVPGSATLAPTFSPACGVVTIVQGSAVLTIDVEFCGTPSTRQSASVVSSFPVPAGHAGSVDSEMSDCVQPVALTVTVSVPPRLSVQELNVSGFIAIGVPRSGPGPMSGPPNVLL